MDQEKNSSNLLTPKTQLMYPNFKHAEKYPQLCEMNSSLWKCYENLTQRETNYELLECSEVLNCLKGMLTKFKNKNVPKGVIEKRFNMSLQTALKRNDQRYAASTSKLVQQEPNTLGTGNEKELKQYTAIKSHSQAESTSDIISCETALNHTVIPELGAGTTPEPVSCHVVTSKLTTDINTEPIYNQIVTPIVDRPLQSAQSTDIPFAYAERKYSSPMDSTKFQTGLEEAYYTDIANQEKNNALIHQPRNVKTSSINAINNLLELIKPSLNYIAQKCSVNNRENMFPNYDELGMDCQSHTFPGKRKRNPSGYSSEAIQPTCVENNLMVQSEPLDYRKITLDSEVNKALNSGRSVQSAKIMESKVTQVFDPQSDPLDLCQKRHCSDAINKNNCIESLTVNGELDNKTPTNSGENETFVGNTSVDQQNGGDVENNRIPVITTNCCTLTPWPIKRLVRTNKTSTKIVKKNPNLKECSIINEFFASEINLDSKSQSKKLIDSQDFDVNAVEKVSSVSPTNKRSLKEHIYQNDLNGKDGKILNENKCSEESSSKPLNNITLEDASKSSGDKSEAVISLKRSNDDNNDQLLLKRHKDTLTTKRLKLLKSLKSYKRNIGLLRKARKNCKKTCSKYLNKSGGNKFTFHIDLQTSCEAQNGKK